MLIVDIIELKGLHVLSTLDCCALEVHLTVQSVGRMSLLIH